MITMLTKGGVLVYIILLCSIFALASFLERLIRVQSFKIDTDTFLHEIETLLAQDNITEAINLCRRFDSPISRIVHEGVSRLDLPREQLMIHLEQAALRELPLLEANLGILSTVAHIAPLLGLLGTVNGMIKAFQVIQTKSATTGLASPADLAQGIWVALITTALGLSVAIPAVIAYNYIYHQILGIKNDMERAATKILSLV